MSETKTKEYQLLPQMHPTAPIYIQAGENEKVRLSIRKKWHPFLQQTVVVDGVSRNIRLKLGSKSIFLEEQIKEGFPANAKFTQAERDAVKFTYGRLVTSLAIVQQFLETTTQFEGFKGSSPEGHRPAYKLFDKSIEVKNQNKDFKLRLKAANIIAEMDFDEAKEMAIRIDGAFAPKFEDVEEAQNYLIATIDSSEEALKEVLKSEKEFTVDDEVNLLIGKLVQAGLLSFDAVENEISVKRDDGWVGIREIDSTQYRVEDRQRFLVEFLTTASGEPLLADLKSLLEKVSEPVK